MAIESFTLPQDKLEESSSKPFSTIFKDRYHSDDGAYEEARHVFIEANKLSEKFEKQNTITIGELGFGFGVSFLETCRFLSEHNKKNNTTHRINFFSIEGFPQTKDCFENFHYHLNSFSDPIVSPYLKELLQQYPKRLRGLHRIHLSDTMILTLAYHPIEFIRESLTLEANCWYLDGFSPSKNPEMWNEKTFSWIYKNTVPHGTFSTYSVSESVQSAASAADFLIKKTSGFGRKSHMLQGLKHPKNPHSLSLLKTPRVAVLGGGLSGASIAYSLSSRGIEVELFEKEHAPAQKASGNKAAIFMPHLSSIPDALSRYYLSGYLYSLRIFSKLTQGNLLPSLKRNGVLRLGNVKKWQSIESRLHELGITEELAIKLNQEQIYSQLRLTSKDTGIFFLEAGSINPGELTSALLKNKIKLHFNSKVTSITSTEEHIELTTSDSSSGHFDYLVFANAHELSEFHDFSWLPFEKIKGQLFSAYCKDSSDTPDIPLCYDGYVVPLKNTNELLIGATYEHNAHETEFSDEVKEDLLSRLKTHFPNIHLHNHITDGRVCFRTTSPDRFPMIGMLPPGYNTRNGTPTRTYTSIGHGSHGTTSCLLAGEIISSMILQEPLPVEDDIMKELEPKRFLKREQKRNKNLEEIYPASYVWRKDTRQSIS